MLKGSGKAPQSFLKRVVSRGLRTLPTTQRQVFCETQKIPNSPQNLAPSWGSQLSKPSRISREQGSGCTNTGPPYRHSAL